MGGESIVDAASAILDAEVAANPPDGRLPFARRDWAAAVAQVLEALNGTTPPPLPSRERLHGLLDQVLDGLATAQTQAAPSRAAQSTTVSLPHIRGGDVAAKPGQTISVSLRLRNDDPTASAELTLATSDLVGAASRRIPHSQLALIPPVVRLAPGGAADVVVQVDIPPDARPDTYRGLIVGAGDDPVQAMLTVRVEVAR